MSKPKETTKSLQGRLSAAFASVGHREDVRTSDLLKIAVSLLVGIVCALYFTGPHLPGFSHSGDLQAQFWIAFWSALWAGLILALPIAVIVAIGLAQWERNNRKREAINDALLHLETSEQRIKYLIIAPWLCGPRGTRLDDLTVLPSLVKEAVEILADKPLHTWAAILDRHPDRLAALNRLRKIESTYLDYRLKEIEAVSAIDDALRQPDAPNGGWKRYDIGIIAACLIRSVGFSSEEVASLSTKNVNDYTQFIDSSETAAEALALFRASSIALMAAVRDAQRGMGIRRIWIMLGEDPSPASDDVN